jgi:hypothetical protein
MLLRGLALILIGEATVRAASIRLDPRLDALADPKYLGATAHFWEFSLIGVTLFLVGWALKPGASDNRD